MRIIFLQHALDDLRWFFYYYDSVFSQGKQKAQTQYYNTKLILKENPYIGKLVNKKNVREFSIPQIPFSFIYRVERDRIEILRIWDERRDRAKFTQE